jgi:hypothetical protein
MTCISRSLVLAMAMTSFLAWGCGDPKPPPKVEETVFGNTVSAKERARVNTESAIDDGQKNLQDAIKKSEASGAQ